MHRRPLDQTSKQSLRNVVQGFSTNKDQEGGGSAMHKGMQEEGRGDKSKRTLEEDNGDNICYASWVVGHRLAAWRLAAQESLRVQLP